jgi:hypothetical protein
MFLGVSQIFIYLAPLLNWALTPQPTVFSETIQISCKNRMQSVMCEEENWSGFYQLHPSTPNAEKFVFYPCPML